MSRLKALLILVLLPLLAAHADEQNSETVRLAELDAYWGAVSRAVRTGDFEGYTATCHPEGVLVSESSGTSYPLSVALERWEQGFIDTRSGKLKSDVEFRFSQRLGDATTAHETGIFRYATTAPDGTETEDFIHFEALLLRQGGSWKSLMEFQRSRAAIEEWEALN